MPKPPRLAHVKYVRSKGHLYAYFNTGEKRSGKAIYTPLPAPSSPLFFSTYATFKAARERTVSKAYTVARACDGYESSREFMEKAEGTKKLYGYALRIIREALGEFPISAIERRHIEAVLDKGLPAPSMHNPFLSVLGVVYRYARRQGKTDLMPTRDFDKAKGGSHKAWPEPVLEAGLQSAHDRTRLAIHLLYFTGQRIGDVCKMRWSDTRDGEIHVVQEKTGKRLWIPMAGDLRRELDSTPKRGLFILTNREGGPMGPQVIRREVKAHAAAMGAKLVPHGLRKNAVISLLEAGCSVYETKAITGQSARVVEQYAAEISQRRLGKAAILKLERKRNRKTGGKTTA